MAKKESGFVSFKDLKRRKGVVSEFDTKEDAFDRPPLPQPGVYKAKITWQDKEEGVIEEKFKLDEDGDPTDEFIGYKLYVQATLLSGKFKGVTIPMWINTYANRGRGNSQALTLLQKAGVDGIKKKMSHARIVELMRDAINEGMVLWVKVSWRGSIKTDEGYENIINNENGFDKKDGVFITPKSVKFRGEWVTVEAQTSIDKVYSANPDLEGEEDDGDDYDEDEKPKRRMVTNEDEEDEDENEESSSEEDEDEEDEEEVVKPKRRGKRVDVKKTGKKRKSRPVEEDEDDDDEDEDED